jgi:hypothetical protein
MTTLNEPEILVKARQYHIQVAASLAKPAAK